MKPINTRPSWPGNQGTGSTLLAFMEAQVAALGYRAVWLATRAVNRRAVEFYIARGYAPIPHYGKYLGNAEAVCRASSLSP